MLTGPWTGPSRSVLNYGGPACAWACPYGRRPRPRCLRLRPPRRRPHARRAAAAQTLAPSPASPSRRSAPRELLAGPSRRGRHSPPPLASLSLSLSSSARPVAARRSQSRLLRRYRFTCSYLQSHVAVDRWFHALNHLSSVC